MNPFKGFDVLLIFNYFNYFQLNFTRKSVYCNREK